MSKKDEEIIRKLKDLSGHRFVNVPGEVVSVDEAKKTCVVKIDKVDYPDIRLNSIIADISDSHSYILPAVDSWVMVSFIENSDTDGYLSAFSEIDKVILRANEIIYNDGGLRGMVKIEALISKLNSIENAFNSLLSNYKAHNHLHPQGPTTAFVAPSTQSNLQNTQLSDIENEKIKQ